jgi:hypothetical protein
MHQGQTNEMGRTSNNEDAIRSMITICKSFDKVVCYYNVLHLHKMRSNNYFSTLGEELV